MNVEFLSRIAPAIFVFLWSTGFIGAKYSMSGAEPFTFLSLRFFLAFILIAIVGSFFASRWPKSVGAYVHLSIVGCLIHGVYLGGVFAAVYHGLPAGVAAIIVSVSPIVVAIFAAIWLGEKLSAINRIGLVLGFIGVTLVIGGNNLLSVEATTAGVALCIAGLLGISTGTLYQKRYCGEYDLFAGASIQYIAASALLAIPAFLIETREITWSLPVIGALLWLVIALSLIAVLLLMYMIRHGEASRVTSLFYLIPGLASLEAWILFNETLSIAGVCGIVLCMIGVYFARRPAVGDST